MSPAPTAVSEVGLRPRYADTDAMGVVYYANYLVYFEVARTTALAELGYPYWEMEKSGVLIPVLRAHCEYLRPARYGDALTIRVRRARLGGARVRFDYELRREGEAAPLATGFTEHAFVNREGKPIRPPGEIIKLFPDPGEE